MDADHFDALTIALSCRRAVLPALLAEATTALVGGGVAQARPLACQPPGNGRK